MKMSDETKTAIFVAIWEVFFLAGTIGYTYYDDNTAMWLFFADTAVQIVILIYDTILEKKKQELKRARELFKIQTENYMRYISTLHNLSSNKD